MRLTSGIAAPDFTASTYDGKPFELRALRGSPVYLTFFRFITCPFCALRIHDLAQRAPQLQQRGLRILAVMQSAAKTLRPSGDRYAGLFTILCDPSEELYRLYRVETSILGTLSPAAMSKVLDGVRMVRSFPPTREEGPVTRTRMPGDFLIDGNGTIQAAHYGSGVTDHIPFSDVDAFLERHAAAPAPPRASAP